MEYLCNQVLPLLVQLIQMSGFASIEDSFSDSPIVKSDINSITYRQLAG